LQLKYLDEALNEQGIRVIHYQECLLWVNCGPTGYLKFPSSLPPIPDIYAGKIPHLQRQVSQLSNLPPWHLVSSGGASGEREVAVSTGTGWNRKCPELVF
jgi:hypothetical protein